MNNGKICVSVCAETADELIQQIKRAEDLADVIEIRFDSLSFSELDNFFKLFKKIKPSIKAPILAAMHKSVETETIETSEETYIIPDTFRVWEKILASNTLDYFDPFQGGVTALLIECWNNFETSAVPIISFFKNAKKHKFIFSHHDFEKVPSELNNIYKTMKETPADIVKIAVQTSVITDTIPIWKLLERAKSDNKQIIPIAMGEAGKWTRILGLAHGAFMTYASLDSGSETAPGQVSASDLIDVYRANELNENTEVYGILGSNTSVSMSPYIHNEAFKIHKLNSVFVPLQVNNLDEFIKRMVKPETREVELNFKGFSVTIPHKQAIIKHLDFIDETAKAIGAVNTVKIVDGKLYGYNTDAQGFIEPLLNSYGDLQRAKVVVIGAGGAARACVYALKKQGAEVTVFARDLEKAKPFAEEFAVELKQLSTNDEPRTTYKEFDILVNTTPLGMKGKADGVSAAIAEQLKGLHLVYDLVYIPFQTPLMQEADIAEVPKIGGLAMLIAQAMEQQKLWTGLDAPMKEMSRAALLRLQS
ncbi:MAG TPA: shikimate dehydrogenase [Pyrinomonadaceae bacterium]|nr:shikimate dehydrogenase [Pyrinomonadaceae bacterium]